MTEFKDFVTLNSNRKIGNYTIEINAKELIISEITDYIDYLTQYTSIEAEAAIAELLAASAAIKKYLK